jgi:DNA modification methylase
MESQMPPLPVVLAPIHKLRPSERNARTHSKKQIKQIAASIFRFGWTYPILVDENYVIIAGHGREKAAETLGLKEVPVLVMSGLSEAEKRALALADNKIAANAGWDRAILAAELSELADLLPECDLNIEIAGFEPAEIDSLMGDLVDPEQDPADAVPTVDQAPVSRRDDIWLLGRHRLLCGDATSASDMRKLMGSDSAAMIFADPPYNVRIASVQGRGKIRHREFVAASGEMSSDEFVRFLVRSLSLAAKYSDDGSIHFICIDWRHVAQLLAAGEKVYTELKNLVVWNKTNAGQGTFYRSQHELICVFKSGDAAHTNNFGLGQHGRSRSNVWTYAGVNTFRDGRLEDLAAHPTVKPVALVADAMRDCSRRGEIVLDPFMGSGTTILAAERVGRRAYGLELDPLYVDVAVRRWQAFTKRDAVLTGTTSTFDEVMAARIGPIQGSAA